MGLARSSNRANTFRSAPGDRPLSGFGGGPNRLVGAVRNLGLGGKYLGGTVLRATLTTALSGSNNDLLYKANLRGAAGNSIRVRYVVSGNNTPLSVAVSDNDITVNVATNGSAAATSTAAQVAAAVNAKTEAARLVTVENATGNDGTGVVTALSYTNLSGGASYKTDTDAPSEA